MSCRTLLGLVFTWLAVVPVVSQNVELTRSLPIRSFEFGSGDEELGFNSMPQASQTSPASIGFDTQGNLFIVDAVNQRISVFESGSFKFLRTIGNIIYTPPSLKVDDRGTLVGEGLGLYLEYSSSGVLTVFLIYPNLVTIRILKQGSVYYYYTEAGGIEGYINPGPDPEVNQRNLKKGAEIRSALTRAGASLSKVGGTSGVFDPRVAPQGSAVQGERAFVGGKLVTKSIYDLLAPEAIGRASASGRVAKAQPSGNAGELAEYLKIVLQPHAHPVFLSRDDGGRTYWKVSGGSLLVLDEQGYIVKIIRFRDSSLPYEQSTGVAVTSGGDIYYLAAKDDTYYLMKLERDW